MIHYEDLQKLHKYGFFVLIFATTAMFFLQEKNVQLLCERCSVVSDPLRPRGLYTVHGILQARILEWAAVPFSKGIFPTQGSNPCLAHCRLILYQLSQEGSPKILEWAAVPFSKGIFPIQELNRGLLHCGGFFTNWAIREAALHALKETILQKEFPLKKAHINLLWKISSIFRYLPPAT